MIFDWYIFKWSTGKEYDQPPYSSDQMIRNLSMKIGEVDSGSARLLAQST